jgi:hypothetical protein
MYAWLGGGCLVQECVGALVMHHTRLRPSSAGVVQGGRRLLLQAGRHIGSAAESLLGEKSGFSLSTQPPQHARQLGGWLPGVPESLLSLSLHSACSLSLCFPFILSVFLPGRPLSPCAHAAVRLANTSHHPTSMRFSASAGSGHLSTHQGQPAGQGGTYKMSFEKPPTATCGAGGRI